MGGLTAFALVKEPPGDVHDDGATFTAHMQRAARLPHAPPLLHYVAPRSLRVFDHLTRAIALLHAGSAAERSALRRAVIAALRGPMP